MPRVVIAISALVALLTGPASAQDTPSPGLVFYEGANVELAEFLWVARPLLVFADAAADPRFAEQMALLADQADALAERDVVVITDTDPATLSNPRTELRPRGFMLALVAKDGSVVFRKPFPWDVREISRAIDKLPLRKQELAQDRALTD
jgi:hypothetical protein